MEIPWPDSRCIVCPGVADTLEHIIPASLLGGLTCKFLCEVCNSRFGALIDSGARSDPAIRSAARALEGIAPKIPKKTEEGQAYLIQTDLGRFPGKMKAGEIQGTWYHLPDGSSLAPEDQAIESMRGRLRAEGLAATQIDTAIERYLDAAVGETVELSPKWKARKVGAFLHGPDMAAPDANCLLFVKIAYEFLALLVGRAIYAASPQLEELRTVLRTSQTSSDAFVVERLVAQTAAPFHGIAFEGNSPHAVFQIRLFGKPAYRVHLRRVALKHKPIAYTFDVATREHWHNLDDEAA